MENDEPIQLLDWRGNTYTVGDTVIYTVAQGNNPVMREAVVEDIIETESPHGYLQDRTIIKVKVRCFRESGWRSPVTESATIEPSDKVQTLTALFRIMKVVD